MTKRGTRDSISAFIGCVGSLAMLAGLLPGLLTSILGLVLIGGAIVTGAVIVLTESYGPSECAQESHRHCHDWRSDLCVDLRPVVVSFVTGGIRRPPAV